MRAALRQQILARDDHTCRYCGRRDDGYDEYTMGHYGRRFRRSDDPANLVAACASCNLAKYDAIWVPA